MEIEPQQTITEVPPINTAPNVPLEPVNLNPSGAGKISHKVIYISAILLFLAAVGGVWAYSVLTQKDISESESLQQQELSQITSTDTDQTPSPTFTTSNEEEDFSGISQMPSTIAPTPVPVVKPVTPPAEKKPVAPANNKSPEVRLLSYGLEDFAHDNDEGVSISARATDPDGTISKVEIYIDGDMKATVSPHPIGGKDEDFDGDIEDATHAASEWLIDEKNENDPGYVYRDSRKWDNDSDGCGISKGYIHIFTGKFKMYDVRTSEDLDKSDMCKESDTMNINDLYYFMWNPDSGSHDTYAIAYDQYGTSTKSDKVNFDVD